MSKRGWRVMGIVAAVMVTAGCRTATRVVDYPRVDLDVSASDNRGYLVGTPPASTSTWKSTRQMVETEIEVPAFSKHTGSGAAGANEGTSPEGDLSEESAWNEPGASHEIIGSYTVKTGDTLWSIAANSSVYSDATKWRWLYDANRDLLKSPDRLHVGMTLKIPRADEDGARPGSETGRAGGQSAEAEPSGMTFKK